MNKEVKETIKILQNNSLVKSGSYEFIGDSDITYAEIYILLKFIEDLQQENQQLKILISAREEVCDRLEEENKKYKEVIDKAIEFLKLAQESGLISISTLMKILEGEDNNE